ncbi:hypothetical protein, partial [Brucella sp. 10RB9213]|uniref:hypothetical protein n=1 Tax=Brucella sp. 10RB9213 TaxID=1844039 RepID=UPI0019D64B43
EFVSSLTPAFQPLFLITGHFAFSSVKRASGEYFSPHTYKTPASLRANRCHETIFIKCLSWLRFRAVPTIPF